MKRSEVGAVLAKVAVYDNRTVDEADVIAWHEILERVDFHDALEAVKRHYTDSGARIMPADVVRLAKVVRDERRRLEPRHAVLELPSKFEDDDDRAVRMAAGAAKVRAIAKEAADKLDMKRQLRRVEVDDAMRAATAPRMPSEPVGAWWEDKQLREEHAISLLAEHGKLDVACDNPNCYVCQGGGGIA